MLLDRRHLNAQVALGSGAVIAYKEGGGRCGVGNHQGAGRELAASRHVNKASNCTGVTHSDTLLTRVSHGLSPLHIEGDADLVLQLVVPGSVCVLIISHRTPAAAFTCNDTRACTCLLFICIQ